MHDVRHITFYEYINDFRLDESEALLRNGDMSIAEIAEQCGFRDRNAFYPTAFPLENTLKYTDISSVLLRLGK